MEAEQLLQELRDIQIPQSVPLWPPAPGWWVLALVVSAALLLGLVAFYRRRALRRQALRELHRLAREYRSEGDALRLVKGVSGLLRRVALARAPRAEVAGLIGPEWLAWLDRDGGNGFSQGAGQVLEAAPYAPMAEIDAGRLLALARHWILDNT